jgi:hypothetical protein
MAGDDEHDDTRGELMFLILLVLLGIVLLAGLVVLYVAYPHRGEQVPRAAWLGAALAKGRNALPVLDEDGFSRSSRSH